MFYDPWGTVRAALHSERPDLERLNLVLADLPAHHPARAYALDHLSRRSPGEEVWCWRRPASEQGMLVSNARSGWYTSWVEPLRISATLAYGRAWGDLVWMQHQTDVSGIVRRWCVAQTHELAVKSLREPTPLHNALRLSLARCDGQEIDEEKLAVALDQTHQDMLSRLMTPHDGQLWHTAWLAMQRDTPAAFSQLYQLARNLGASLDWEQLDQHLLRTLCHTPLSVLRAESCARIYAAAAS